MEDHKRLMILIQVAAPSSTLSQVLAYSYISDTRGRQRDVKPRSRSGFRTISSQNRKTQFGLEEGRGFRRT